MFSPQKKYIEIEDSMAHYWECIMYNIVFNSRTENVYSTNTFIVQKLFSAIGVLV